MHGELGGGESAAVSTAKTAAICGGVGLCQLSAQRRLAASGAARRCGIARGGSGGAGGVTQ